MKDLRMILVFTALVIICAAGNSYAVPPTFTTLQPGQFREINQTLQINIVFVGFEPGTGPRDIRESTIRNNLPRSYRSINRVPTEVLGQISPTGLHFSFVYNFVYADAAFENAYFQYLSSIAVAGTRTEPQDYYNQQNARSLTVGQNHRINGTSAEKWLAENAGPMLGVDTARYTVFFVNWFGRSDFKFHVYVNPGDPDPDTGHETGLEDLRATIAWGGTTADDAETGLGSLHRVWFYDLSAGPNLNTGSDDVDTFDLNGDGFRDYRIPSVWEYGNLTGYRPFTNLSGDLSLLVRYVAINLLFTTSPLYKTAISPPELPSNVQLDINLYEQDTTFDANSFLTPPFIQAKISKLQPYNAFSTEVNEAPLRGQAQRVLDCWAVFQPCYGQPVGGIVGELFTYHKQHVLQFIEGDADYEIPIFLYSTTNAYLNAPLLGGVADSNHYDGTQSYVFIHQPRLLSEEGIGYSETVLHEVGHHLGMSHPHDGYDFERNQRYGPLNSFYFAWAGTESATIMGYLFANHDFSQFDRDNMDRYMTVSYINEANVILGKVLTGPRAGEVGSLLFEADQNAADALTAYGSMEYTAAALFAKDAYEKVLAAARQINVPVEKQAWPADYRSNGSSFMLDNVVDDFRNLRNRAR